MSNDIHQIPLMNGYVKSFFDKHQIWYSYNNHTSTNQVDSKFIVKIAEFLKSGYISIDNFSLDDKIELIKHIVKYEEMYELFHMIRRKIYDDLEHYVDQYKMKSIESLHDFDKSIDLCQRLTNVNIYILIRFFNIDGKFHMKIIYSGDKFKLTPVRYLWYHKCKSYTGKTIISITDLPNFMHINDWIDESFEPTQYHDSTIMTCSKTACGHHFACSVPNYNTHSIDDICSFCKKNNDNDNDICPITNQSIIRQLILDCKHKFEQSAILSWLVKNNSCPVCRVKIA